MASVTLGRKRNVLTIVPINDAVNFQYNSTNLSAITGVSATDVTALGHLTTAPEGTLTITGCNAPQPAVFKKILGGGAVATTQKAVSAYGNASTKAAIAAARAAGWFLIKPIRSAQLGGGDKKTGVVVPLSNGLYEIVNVYTEDATATNASLFGWNLTPGDTITKKMFRASSMMRAGRVKKKVTVSGKTGTQVLPCQWSKLESADVKAAGWRVAYGERISDA